jgi:hypothetical protein
MKLLVHFEIFVIAQDCGQYIRVGELGPNSTEEELNKAFTLRDVVAKARRGGKAAPVGIGSLGFRITTKQVVKKKCIYHIIIYEI